MSFNGTLPFQISKIGIIVATITSHTTQLKAYLQMKRRG